MSLNPLAPKFHPPVEINQNLNQTFFPFFELKKKLYEKKIEWNAPFRPIPDQTAKKEIFQTQGEGAVRRSPKGEGGVWFRGSNNTLYIAGNIKGLRRGGFKAYDKTNWLAH